MWWSAPRPPRPARGSRFFLGSGPKGPTPWGTPASGWCAPCGRTKGVRTASSPLLWRSFCGPHVTRRDRTLWCGLPPGLRLPGATLCPSAAAVDTTWGRRGGNATSHALKAQPRAEDDTPPPGLHTPTPMGAVECAREGAWNGKHAHWPRPEPTQPCSCTETEAHTVRVQPPAAPAETPRQQGPLAETEAHTAQVICSETEAHTERRCLLIHANLPRLVGRKAPRRPGNPRHGVTVYPGDRLSCSAGSP